MSKDPELQALLDEINPYVDNLPARGSSENLRFLEALDQLLARSKAIAEPPLRPDRDHRGRTSDENLRRSDPQTKANTRVLGASSAHAEIASKATVARSKP